MMNSVSAWRPSAAALRSRVTGQFLPAVMMTFAISKWAIAVLGPAKASTILITFAWAAVTGHQLVMSRRTEREQQIRWSADQILGGVGGQIVWVALPWLQQTRPDAWYCLPLTLSPALVGFGAMMAVCWPLRLFVAPASGHTALARHSEFDALVLYGSFFLLSGNLIFAASAYLSVAILFLREVNWREMSLRSGTVPVTSFTHGMSLDPEARPMLAS